MIVYGDPRHRESLALRVSDLLTRIAACGTPLRLEEARKLLVLAGQLEQALADAHHEAHSIARAATDCAAMAAFLTWSDRAADAELRRMARALGSVPRRDELLDFKVPEGFAFYGLFPEQFFSAALRWSDEHAGMRDIAAIGIRSIGTALSAAIAAVLRATGRRVHRYTVRPTGHPFARTAAVEPSPDAEGWLIADEGPGLSGSSMAAVAEALVRAGAPEDAISFFPSHAGEPSHPSPSVARWWSLAPRYTARSELLDRGVPISSGLWRRYAYEDESQWPAVAAPFERPKLLLDRRLLKFFGDVWDRPGTETAAEHAFARLRRVSELGYGPMPSAIEDGFVERPWIEGRPLRAEDASAEMMSHVARYLAASAGPPIDHPPSLASMAIHNAREAGIDPAPIARAAPGSMHRSPRYQDGRMAPHEWLRCSSGIVKVDAAGHDVDHTIVGEQSIAWDVAGALIEWDLKGEIARTFTAECCSRIGLPAEMIAFHRLAYAAFRLGQTKLCLDQSEGREKRRLAVALERYRGALDDPSISSIG